MTPPACIVVAGYGNPLRRDDGAGWWVAARVAQQSGERVTVLMGQQPVPEWAETLSQAELAYIVDAARGGAPQLALRRLVAADDYSLSTAHQFDAQHLLGLTRAVYARAPEAYLLLVPAYDVGLGQELSPRTARAVDVAVRYLTRRIRCATPDARQGTATSTLSSARSDGPVGLDTISTSI